MESSPQSEATTGHPLQIYLKRLVSLRDSLNKIEGLKEPSLRVLPPGELESLVTEHQKWLESDNYQKWVSVSTEEKNQYVQGRADLSLCNLQRANLEQANLRHAVLWQANLQGASLQHVNLEKADLWGANFEDTNLGQAQLANADAWDANFLGANLYGADLRDTAMGGANFQKASLVDAQLQQAFLGECNFQEANLTRANFFRADLRDTVFQQTNLTGTSFRETNLQNANFLRSSGLQEGSFAGAILSDTTFPDECGTFRHGLRFVEETSKTITTGLLLLLITCAYALLTLWSTSDAQLLTNSSSAGLPIIPVEVPITSFLTFSPCFLLAFYIYWHLYSETVWRGVAQLPAIFPNGRAVDLELFSWIVNGFIRPHVFHLRKLRPFVVRFQHMLLRFLIWWLVPLSIGMFWLIMLPLHDWTLTGLQILLVVFAVVAATWFQQRSRKILRGESHSNNLPLTQTLLTQGWWKPLVVGTLTLCVLTVISDGAINGMPLQTNQSLIRGQLPQMKFLKEELGRRGHRDGYLSTHRTLVPILLHLVGARAFADISHLEVSERLPNRFTQGEKGVPEELVKGAHLSGANLHNISGVSAFLKHADLQKVNLREANLISADLEGANLLRANLHGANLRGANLQGGNLFEANLQAAELGGANLQAANFFEANLREAGMVGARLQDSKFVGANLQGALLNGADFSKANMGRANLTKASLKDAILTRVNFFEALLDHANLYGAHVQETNFVGASLKQTNLQGVDLSAAINLTQEQINQACLNPRTKLPKNLVPPKACTISSP